MTAAPRAEPIVVGSTKPAHLTINYLRQVSARTRFISIEPLLEDLGSVDLTGIAWAIVGGESGPGARPMKTEWVQNIRRQCGEQDVRFFFKQWGAFGADGVRRSKKANGRVFDGASGTTCRLTLEGGYRAHTRQRLGAVRRPALE